MILPLTAPDGQLSITSVIKKNPNKKYVKQMQEYSSKLTMHMTGLNLPHYLAKIDYFEKTELLELRQKYSPSNEDFFGRLHRPIDKIWSAKGGSANYYLEEGSKKKFLSTLKELNSGNGLRSWLETFWLLPSHYDPMGVTYIEVDDMAKAYPVYRSCHDYFDVPVPKGRKYDYIIFKCDDRIDRAKADPANETNIYYRVVDDIADYLIRWDGDSAHIVDEYSYDNHFDMVPAITNGNIFDPITKTYISPDHEVIGVADQHLRDRSVLTMFKLHHGFPIKWMYGSTDCPTCDGRKKVSGKDCPSCAGTGRKSKFDVSETILLPIPKQGDPLLDKGGGYFTPPVESWDKMDSTIEQEYKDAHYTKWGTNQLEDSESAQPQTATGRFIDVQPVNDRLNKYSDASEYQEAWITDMLGGFYFQSYQGCEISYGRRFLIETPDEILKKFGENKKAGVSYLTLSYLHLQWLQTEFQSDSVEYGKQLKLYQLDYLPLLTMQEAKAVIDDLDFLDRKLYFPQWVQQLQPNDLITKTLEVLRGLRDRYLDDVVTKKQAARDMQQQKEAKLKNTKIAA